MKKVSEQIADWLVEQGVEQVFSVTGGGAMFLNIALGTHPKLKCTFMHHEQACAMAAEGYARVTNKPAVVMVTTGPGAINAMNGVFGAYTDSIPMIVLSGQVKSDTCVDFYDLPNLRQLGDQEGPIVKMAQPITKYAKLIRTPLDLEQALPEAYSQSVSGRPGPVWLDIPLDIQNSTEQLSFKNTELRTNVASPTLETECKYLLDKIKTACRPLILAGTGVRLAGVKDRLLSLVEKTGIPMATAWTHDLIPTNHPLFAGRPGSIGTRAGNFCLQGADLVLVIGSRLNIRQTGYNFDGFAKDAYVAQVDVDAEELKKPTFKADQPIHADAGQFLNVIETLLEDRPLSDYSEWANWCKGINQKYSVANEHSHPADTLNPYLVVKEIFDNSYDTDVFVCGNASACILPWQVGTIKGSQRLFSNSGAASMGHDLPTAIGASTVANRVICFAGDGSLQMNIQELQTLKTLGTNVIIIVLNNSGYLSIRQTHENFFGTVVGATPESGVEFPDFAKVAVAYGIPSFTITSKSELSTVKNLMNRKGPMLLDIKVDPKQNFSPRMKARLDENGKFIPQFLDDMFPFLDAEEVANVRESAKKI
jgi:acetolactate synthase-1/2/3 large subunit